MWQLVEGSINILIGIGAVAYGATQICDWIAENVHRNEMGMARGERLYVLINNKGAKEYKSEKELLTSPTDVVKEEPKDAPIPAIADAVPGEIKARPCCCEDKKKECEKCGFDQCVNSAQHKDKEIGNIFWSCTPTDLEKKFTLESKYLHRRECKSCYLVDKTDMDDKLKGKTVPVDDDGGEHVFQFTNKGVLPNYNQQQDMGRVLTNI